MKKVLLISLILVTVFLCGCEKKDVEKKDIITCTMTESDEDYVGNIKSTTTFEENEIVYFTMHIEKAFNEGFKAEDDDWTMSNMESFKNMKDGMTGDIYIKNNTTYVTINYDVKNYPSLIDYITEHTQREDFLENMENNGYICSENNK